MASVSYLWIVLLVVLPPLVLLYKVAAPQDRSILARATPRVVRDVLEPRTSEQVEEDLFWFRLLAPLIDRTGRDRERALSHLAGVAHVHPTHGRRRFDATHLRRQLERVSLLNPATLSTTTAGQGRRRQTPGHTLPRSESLERAAG